MKNDLKAKNSKLTIITIVCCSIFYMSLFPICILRLIGFPDSNWWEKVEIFWSNMWTILFSFFIVCILLNLLSICEIILKKNKWLVYMLALFLVNLYIWLSWFGFSYIYKYLLTFSSAHL
jgi:hypothetical protein